jgi:hypothetical protein
MSGLPKNFWETCWYYSCLKNYLTYYKFLNGILDYDVYLYGFCSLEEYKINMKIRKEIVRIITAGKL